MWEKMISNEKSKVIYNSHLKEMCFRKMQLLWLDWRVDLRDLRYEAERVVRDLLKMACQELWNPKPRQ